MNSKVLEPSCPLYGTTKPRALLKRDKDVTAAAFFLPHAGVVQTSSEGDNGLTGTDTLLPPTASDADDDAEPAVSELSCRSMAV